VSEPRPVLVHALRLLLGAAAAAAILGYLSIAAAHLAYPHELEWIEGAMVDEAARLASGKPLYVKPTLDYVPFIYAPLWFHVTALFSKVFGVGFFAARLVSVLSSVASMGLIAATVHRETKDRMAAVAGAGLYAVAYPIAASFYDLARVDSLFVALLLGGLYVVRFHTTTLGDLTASALFALAFFTKQSAPIAFAPVVAYVLATDGRRGAVLAGVTGALMALGVLLYNASSHGWFWHFCFVLPAAHTIVKRAFVDFWVELFVLLGLACTLAIAALSWERRQDVKKFHAFAAAGMFGAALAGRVHLGGWSNVLCPAYAMLGVLVGLGLAVVTERTARAAGASGASRALVPVALSMVILQLALRAYDPRQFLAPAGHARAWDGLIAEIRALEGDVLVSAHGFVGPRAGKQPHAHQMAISDELRSVKSSPTAQALRREIVRAIEQKQFGAILFDNVWLPMPLLAPHYRKHKVPPMQTSLGPVIGWQVARPSGVWVPKP
jgi:hypothetical protein